jgi:hypothetical protein
LGPPSGHTGRTRACEGWWSETNVAPLGERILQSILDYVVANGDAAESSYPEAKSTVDIASKPWLVKVARFLLVCANRQPEDAARQFKGYAVLVIGARQGAVGGVACGAVSSSRTGSASTWVWWQARPDPCRCSLS